ncbi:MAG: transglutaminase domain-containing protein [Verrucomicrobiota bacterium]
MSRRLLPLACLIGLLIIPSLFALPRGIVVVGLAGDEVQTARFQTAAELARSGLIARGVPSDAIIRLGTPTGRDRARRDAILAALAPRPDAASDDETWIILIGTATTRAGQPTFQVSGPRLTSEDLAAAVAALPGKKYVVFAGANSGGFLPPLLARPDVEAVAATADAGEINEPRFIEFWPQVFAQKPDATFAEIAAAAAAQIESFYKETGLAQGEHARLIDRATNTILEAPFSPDLLAANARAAKPRPPAEGFSAADIDIPKPSDDLDLEHLPATDETRALIAEAQAAAAGSEHAALILRREADLVVGRDFSTRETWSTRSYVITGEALDDLASIRLPSATGAGVSRLVAARVIHSDGSQLLINLPKLAADARDEAEKDRPRPGFDGPVAPPYIELPEVVAGCVVELAYTHESRDSAQLPAFYDEWHLADRYPVLSSRMSVTRPIEDRWHSFAPNLPAPEVVDTDTTRTETWNVADIAAREPLPGDPPARTFMPWIGLSSIASWDGFADWYRRLSEGSETPDSKVEAIADEIAAAHAGRMERIRAAYERVAELRYVAIDLGIGAFRPRSPGKVWRQRYGDCKDKANLLVAILRRMDIPAEFVLVNRFDVTFTEFPGWQFNHALARVPAAPEAGQPHALWLDSTDRLVPFGIIAPGNLGRQGLVFSKGFESAEFHEITGEQEPPAVWREKFTHEHVTGARELRVTATGPAEVVLRQTFANLPPQIRRERIRQMLGWGTASIDSVDMPDPYDLSVPFVLTVKFDSNKDFDPRITPRSLVPGLAAYAYRFHRPPYSLQLLWNDGRDWTFYRTEGDTESEHFVPGRRTQFPSKSPSPAITFPY